MSIHGRRWLRRSRRAFWIARGAVFGVLVAVCHCDAQQTVERINSKAPNAPGCEGLDAHGCLDRATRAMGGREKLASIRTEQLDLIGHTELMEQSYRQSPFFTSYTRESVTIDYAGQRMFRKEHAVWPESDLKQADSDSTLIVTPAGGVIRNVNQDSPSDAAKLNGAREALSLGSEKILLTAADARDLHYAAPETLRQTAHTVLAFTWNGIAVRVLLNPFNQLPDAVETTQEFSDFWFYWGDVNERVYFDNWRWVGGVEYPSNQIRERNGAVWSSTQALDIVFNKPVEDKDFAVDAKAAAASSRTMGWKSAVFRAGHDTPLAEGIDLFLGSWNTTIVKQADGVVILETPLSSSYTEGILSEANKRYPGAPVKAVVSTSDSWPHVGGVRYDVARELPVYILDLNKPLLERMLAAPHRIDPDALELAKKKTIWRVVADRMDIGTGANRMVLVPLRGPSTERQYMVYFPERRLLYASDTLVVNDDRTLYDPQLFHEVEQAVEREHFAVDTVYAMHQPSISWSEAVSMLRKAA